MIFTDQKLERIPRRFISPQLDITQWDEVKAELETLTAVIPVNADSLLKMMEHASELSKALTDELSWRYIRMTLNADKEDYATAYNDFNANVFAPCEPYRFMLQQIFYNSPARKDLPKDKFEHLEKIIANEIELFREENIPLKVQEQELATQYGAICSKMSALFEGEERTPSQLAVFLKDPDRTKREQAWRLLTNCYAEKRDELDKLFDELKALRMKIAANAGFDNFRDYMHQAMGRFSYTPEDIYKFHFAVEKVVVPFVGELNRHRKEVLKIDTIKPWDTSVDLDGKKLKPFDTIDEFVNKAIIIEDKVKPDYGIQLEMMQNSGMLDLENRKGKAPGGYNSSICELGSSFIFMNAVKLHNDVVTLLHEAGHAMHGAAARNIAIDYYCNPPSEVAELASMAMELLTMDYWDEYYKDEADLKKAKRDQLEGTLTFLPWCMTVDAFQHWVYLNSEHTSEERRNAFVSIQKRFSAGVDWTGLEELRKIRWMQQLHIFEVPFYYIEYGMAQLGALAIYKNYRENKSKALQQYQDFLNIGYSKPVRDIYKAAGISFDFSESYLKELVDFVKAELTLLK
jgi:oligoendopeptidase F